MPPSLNRVKGINCFQSNCKSKQNDGTLNTLQAREMLTMKMSYIGRVLLLKLKCVSGDRSMLGNLLR